MTEEPPIADPEVEIPFDSALFLALRGSEIFREMCCMVLSDAMEHPEAWSGSDLRQRIVHIASCVIKTACQETVQ